MGEFDGEITIEPFILEDFGDDGLDYWVSGFGTGGTMNGVARVLKARSPKTRIIATEPSREALSTTQISAERELVAKSASRLRKQSANNPLTFQLTMMMASSVTPKNL